MANRHIAFLFVMSHEDVRMSGVVVTDNDGGQVRFGVNSNSNPQAISDGFYAMSKEDALAYAEIVFVSKYWNKIDGDNINNQRVANQCVDLYFNSGNEVVLIMQRAANRFQEKPIEVDGKFGPMTLDALNFVPDQLVLLDAIKAQAIVFYQGLVEKDPVKYNAQIYRSWVSRLNA